MASVARAYMDDRRRRVQAAQAPGYIEDALGDMELDERARNIGLFRDQQSMGAEARDLARIYALQQAQYGLGTTQRQAHLRGARAEAEGAGSAIARDGAVLSGVGGAVGGGLAGLGQYLKKE
jgi:hypothetical protein